MTKAGYMGTCQRPPSYMRGAGKTYQCENCEKIGIRWFPICRPGYRARGAACEANCPEGTIDAGWEGCKKEFY